jgi:Fibronectin type III domain
MAEPKPIRASDGFSRVLDLDVLARGQAVLTGLSGNPAYEHPPVDLAVLKAALDSYSAAIAEALDGSKRAIADRNKRRQEVITMLRLLARYVETACKNDVAIFASSGFEAVSRSRTPYQPLAQPTIDYIDQGNSGQLLVAITPVKNARSYDLRCAALSGGTPGQWTTISVTSSRPAIPVNGLTPGTIYAFQVRALGKSGHTDWSDSSTRMCI